MNLIQATLDLDEQLALLDDITAIFAKAPPFVPTVRSGARMHYRITNAGSLGWLSDTQGYRYVAEHPQTHEAWPPMPSMVYALAIKLANAAGWPNYRPESCLINLYELGSTLGRHQDKDEATLAPVISISLGCTGIFALGGRRYSDPTTVHPLRSGNVMMLANQTRMLYHAVTNIIPDTSPLDALKNQRINLTVRQAT